MRRLKEGRKLLFGKKHKRDDRGSAIVIVIIAMAFIGVLASTIIWASYLNYRIKINDMQVKNSFYSAETIIEQILAGVKKDVVSTSINEAYQEVVSNWDALGTDANRESYFITLFTESVKDRLGVKEEPLGSGVFKYDKSILKAYVDEEQWKAPDPANPDAVSDPNKDGYIVNKPWNDADPVFVPPDYTSGSGSMHIKNICIEFYDADGLLSIINTDIAIDVPKLRFTQAGTIDRLYPYVLVGDEGIETTSLANTVNISGSIYGGNNDQNDGGIRIAEESHVTIADASYVISGGDIVVGTGTNFVTDTGQNAGLVVQNVTQDSKGFRTNVYARGLVVNGSHLDITGRTYIANDLILSGRGSSVSLTGQYFGYGNTNSNTDSDGEGGSVNPANSSSAIVINGKDSTVDLTGLTSLQLAGRAYVSLSRNDETEDDGLPHVLMGESISVKSNQIAYLVPPECIGTLDGRVVIGQNPISFTTWSEMISGLSGYAALGQDFKIVNAGKAVSKLGGINKLSDYGIQDLSAGDLGGTDLGASGIAQANSELNRIAAQNGIRFYYQQGNGSKDGQVYLYLLMNDENAENYFAQYYNVNSNKASLNNYFNQYASGGIRLKGNVQGYTVVGNSMVSVTDAADGDRIQVIDGQNQVKLMASIEEDEDEAGDGGEDGEDSEEGQAREPGYYEEVSDNVDTVINQKDIDELNQSIEDCVDNYKNLTKNLLEENSGREATVFENLVKVDFEVGDSDAVMGLQEYLDANGGKVEFTNGNAGDPKAVLVDSSGEPDDIFEVNDADLRLVIAIGDVEVTGNFRGLILASGKIIIDKRNNVTIEKDGEGVYSVLQAPSTKGDGNVPANILFNGSGMVKNGYEDAETDENGNLAINYSEIVRYENWIKK